MSSIRSILEELAFKHAEDGFTYSDPHDVGVDYKLIDQALKDISELIDGVIGEDDKNYCITDNSSREDRLSQAKVVVKNKLRTEQRNRLKELLK